MTSFTIIDFLLLACSAVYSFKGFESLNRGYFWNKRYVWANVLGYGGFFFSILLFIIFIHIDFTESNYNNFIALGVVICVIFIIGFCWFIMDGISIKMELDYKFQRRELTYRYEWCKAWKKVITITEIFLILLAIWGGFVLA